MTQWNVLIAASLVGLLVIPLVLRVRRLEKMIDAVAKGSGKGGRPGSRNPTRDGESLQLTFDFSDDLVETLDHIEETTGDPPEAIIIKALSLYRVSSDAHKEGKRIGVLDKDYELEREVVGFDHQLAL